MEIWLIMGQVGSDFKILAEVSGEESWALAYGQRTFGKNVWVEPRGY